jgi:hypothetical protein
MEWKNAKSRSTAETDGFSTAGIFGVNRCGSFSFHLCLVKDSGCASHKAQSRGSRGIGFIDENGGGPGMRLRKRHQKKS